MGKGNVLVRYVPPGSRHFDRVLEKLGTRYQKKFSKTFKQHLKALNKFEKVKVLPFDDGTDKTFIKPREVPL